MKELVKLYLIMGVAEKTTRNSFCPDRYNRDRTEINTRRAYASLAKGHL